MNIEDLKFKIAGLCALISPIVAFVCIFVAISLSPWFSWSGNALSDLGVRGTAATVFNSGLMVSGLLTMVFAAGLFEAFRGRILGRIGAVALFLGAISLFAVGAFPESAGAIHSYVSVAFFALLPISLITIGASMVIAKSRVLGSFSILVAVLAALPWAVSWNALAVPETMSVFTIAVWDVTMGLKLYRGTLVGAHSVSVRRQSS